MALVVNHKEDRLPRAKGPVEAATSYRSRSKDPVHTRSKVHSTLRKIEIMLNNKETAGLATLDSFRCTLKQVENVEQINASQ